MTVLRTNSDAQLGGYSDAELISCVRAGDIAAYGELFSRHRQAAERLARQLVSGPDADDLVSEAFAKVLHVLMEGGGPDMAFRAYLLTAVRRLHVDKVRAAARATPTDDLTPYDSGEPFSDTVLAGFEGEAAGKAFASLPERWQLVLWHLEVEGQKPADIAQMLGMSANSVSALAYRAREGLRQAYLQMHAADLSDDKCRWTHDRLGAYVRKGLSRRDTHKVEEHLENCRSCTAMYLELTEVNSSLAMLIGPLVLGGAAAGYIGLTAGTAATATGGAGALGVLAGRVRDLVGTHSAVAVGVGAAATVATVATAVTLVVNPLGSDDPGKAVGDPGISAVKPVDRAPGSAADHDADGDTSTDAQTPLSEDDTPADDSSADNGATDDLADVFFPDPTPPTSSGGGTKGSGTKGSGNNGSTTSGSTGTTSPNTPSLPESIVPPLVPTDPTPGNPSDTREPGDTTDPGESGGTTNPGDTGNSSDPGDDSNSTNPGDNGTDPDDNDNSTNPGDNGTDPGDNGTDPGDNDNSTNPGDNGTDPGDGTDPDPGDNGTDPGDNGTNPGDGTDPDPGDNGTDPDDNGSDPGDGTDPDTGDNGTNPGDGTDPDPGDNGTDPGDNGNPGDQPATTADLSVTMSYAGSTLTVMPSGVPGVGATVRVVLERTSSFWQPGFSEDVAGCTRSDNNTTMTCQLTGNHALSLKVSGLFTGSFVSLKAVAEITPALGWTDPDSTNNTYVLTQSWF